MSWTIPLPPLSATDVAVSGIQSLPGPDGPVRHDGIAVVIDGREHKVKIEFRRGGSDLAETHALTPALAGSLRPETFEMARPIQPSHHRSNRPGLFWFSSVGHFVAHESRLEAANLLVLDFEARTAAVSAQPFRLHLTGSQAPRDHVPDFFARTVEGRGVVVDVKPLDRLQDLRVEAQFAATRSLCEQAGWEYRIMCEPSDNERRNLALLAGYRRVPVLTDVVMAAAMDTLAAGPTAWEDLLGECAALTDLHTALVSTCLLHGVWDRQISFDLSAPLTAATVISMGGGRA